MQRPTFCPPRCPAPPIYAKVNPADAPVITLAISSRSLPITQLVDIVGTRIAQKISQLLRRRSGQHLQAASARRCAFRPICRKKKRGMGAVSRRCRARAAVQVSPEVTRGGKARLPSESNGHASAGDIGKTIQHLRDGWPSRGTHSICRITSQPSARKAALEKNNRSWLAPRTAIHSLVRSIMRTPASSTSTSSRASGLQRLQKTLTPSIKAGFQRQCLGLTPHPDSANTGISPPILQRMQFSPILAGPFWMPAPGQSCFPAATHYL